MSGDAAAPPATLTDLAWRAAFRLGYPAARVWWRLRRAPHEGALVAVHVGPALLLLRTSYRRGWTFPGGGVSPGETPEAAARRELAEELGLSVPRLERVGVVSGNWEGRPDRVTFFAVRLATLPKLRLDNREIVAAKLVPLAQVPRLRLTGAVGAYVGMTGAIGPGIKA